jgi:hypothetical protein
MFNRTKTKNKEVISLKIKISSISTEYELYIHFDRYHLNLYLVHLNLHNIYLIAFLHFLMFQLIPRKVKFILYKILGTMIPTSGKLRKNHRFPQEKVPEIE